VTAVTPGRDGVGRLGTVRARAVVAGALTLVVLAGCTSSPPAPSAPSPVPATAGSGAGSASPAAPAPSEPVEPTTTNTLPPPPEPTGPAPSTAGDLDASVLPVPAGWRTVAREGGDEDGYEGNGTWVHARDARYAAQDTITIGCAEVTRDDYPDPRLALEGSYQSRTGSPGVGLVLQFADPDAAGRYWARYVEQVQACRTVTEPVRTELVPLEQPADGEALLDRRSYPDGEWTEVGVRRGDRVTLVILQDDHHLTPAQAARVVAQVR